MRVVELRKAFWVYANLGSIAAVAEDNGNEHIRASLVNVDAEKDMLAFLATARTGSVRPGKVYVLQMCDRIYNDVKAEMQM